MHKPFIRATVRLVDATIAAGRRAAHLERPARTVPGPDRREDRPHERRRLVARSPPRAGPGVTIYATLLGSPDAAQRNADLAAAARLGALALPARSGVDRRPADVRDRAELPYGRGRACGSSRRARAAGRPARPPARRAGRRPDRRSRCRSGGASGSARCGSTTGARLVASSPLVAARAVVAAGRTRPRSAGTRTGPLHHLWGLHARDRHRHAQRRDRPHADRAELPARPAAPRERRR